MLGFIERKDECVLGSADGTALDTGVGDSLELRDGVIEGE
jgi:hypothetical protein